MKLDAFSGRDIQMFLTMLNMAEADSVTDIRFVRQRIDDYVRKSRGRVTKSSLPNTSIHTAPPLTCPACGHDTLYTVTRMEGLDRLGCRCGYSREA